MSFLKDQIVEVDDKENISVTNHFDTTELEKELAEERKIDQNGKSLRKVCSIPEFEFQIDPMLIRYQMYCELGDAESARTEIRNFLKLNPQYLATKKRF